MHPSIAEKRDDRGGALPQLWSERGWRCSARRRAGAISIRRRATRISWSPSGRKAVSLRSTSVFGFAEALEDILGRPVDLVRILVGPQSVSSRCDRPLEGIGLWKVIRASDLWDAGQAADEIVQFTAALDAAGYQNNPLVRAAVERKFEIIGEALNKLCKACARARATRPASAADRRVSQPAHPWLCDRR